jgi:membrane-bound metal-dependent hydrolase YbcI (DUF457 family)
MPNIKKHATTGAIVGGGLNLAWQLSKVFGGKNPPQSFWGVVSRIDFLQVAAFGAIGAAAACLPDLIEPADSPNHRALFHSFCCGGAVTYGAFGEHTKDLESEDKHALQVVALSYLSHLCLDGCTPKGLPLIC